MKDIIKNRVRISSSVKARLLALSVRENGLLWTTLIGGYYVASATAEKLFTAADRLRRRRDLPGMNSPTMNKLIWEKWDWTGKGEEWTPSEEWKRSVIGHLLRPNIPDGSVVVEIGPGGGRWTDELQKRARTLIGVDLSEACVSECRKRFAGCDNVEFLVGNGSDLCGIATGSVDAIWSFDVFVHINKTELKSYATEFARVLKPGGRGVIQHGSVSGTAGGWRSNVMAEDFCQQLAANGLEVIEQLATWWDSGREFRPGLYEDVVTIFWRPVIVADDGADI